MPQPPSPFHATTPIALKVLLLVIVNSFEVHIACHARVQQLRIERWNHPIVLVATRMKTWHPHSLRRKSRRRPSHVRPQRRDEDLLLSLVSRSCRRPRQLTPYQGSWSSSIKRYPCRRLHFIRGEYGCPRDATTDIPWHPRPFEQTMTWCFKAAQNRSFTFRNLSQSEKWTYVGILLNRIKEVGTPSILSA